MPGEGAGRGEHRWPAAASVVVALLLYGLLPSAFLPIVRYAVIAVSVVLGLAAAWLGQTIGAAL